jgi:flagellin-like protein
MRKLLKSKKALSPVVAAIILIAVTVAVSIAVAAWMGSLTIGFMETSEVTINDMEFVSGTPNTITLDLTNTGTSAVTISMVKVNGDSVTFTGTATLDPSDETTLTISEAWVAGNKYSVSMFTTDGTLVGSWTATA